MNNETKKCAHPGCKCLVPKDNAAYGEYCSEHCKQAKDMTEIHCDCGHKACE